MSISAAAISKTFAALVVACGSTTADDAYRVCSIGVYTGLQMAQATCDGHAVTVARDLGSYLSGEGLQNVTNLGICLAGGTTKTEVAEADDYVRNNFGADNTMIRYYRVLPTGEPVLYDGADLAP